MITFSIIIPTYNSAQTLKRALESVLQQSYQNFEILILDGLSADETVKIAESYTDSRIKIHSEKDAGVYDAMNKGIDKSVGEWLYFLGSDDVLYNDEVLLKVANFIHSVTADVVYGNVKTVYDLDPSLANEIYDGKFYTGKLFVQNFCHQSIFYKKTLVTKVGYYNLSYPILADYDYNLRAWKVGKFKFINLIVAEFAYGGLSANADLSFRNDFKNNLVKYYFGLEPNSKWFSFAAIIIKMKTYIYRIQKKLSFT